MDDVTYLIFPMALSGFWVLALMGIACLVRCRGKNRRYLAWTAAVFLGALALYFGGLILLGIFGLTWRNVVAMILCGTLLVSGWAGIVLTLACALPMEMPGIPAVLRWPAKGLLVLFAAVVFLVTLWVGPMGIALVYGNSERVVKYQGQTLVEVDEGFLDPWYSCYVYCGPLVRGTERVQGGPTPIDGDSN